MKDVDAKALEAKAKAEAEAAKAPPADPSEATSSGSAAKEDAEKEGTADKAAAAGEELAAKETIPDGKLHETLLEKVSKSQAYSHDKSSYGLVKGLSMEIVEVALLLMGQFPFFWSLSKSAATACGIAPESEILISLVFLGISTVFDTIVSTPWSYYYTFVLEQKHGFNKMDLKVGHSRKDFPDSVSPSLYPAS